MDDYPTRLSCVIDTCHEEEDGEDEDAGHAEAQGHYVKVSPNFAWDPTGLAEKCDSTETHRTPPAKQNSASLPDPIGLTESATPP